MIPAWSTFAAAMSRDSAAVLLVAVAVGVAPGLLAVLVAWAWRVVTGRNATADGQRADP